MFNENSAFQLRGPRSDRFTTTGSIEFPRSTVGSVVIIESTSVLDCTARSCGASMSDVFQLQPASNGRLAIMGFYCWGKASNACAKYSSFIRFAVSAAGTSRQPRLITSRRAPCSIERSGLRAMFFQPAKHAIRAVKDLRTYSLCLCELAFMKKRIHSAALICGSTCVQWAIISRIS